MLKTTHFIAFLPSSSANLSVISVISKKVGTQRAAFLVSRGA